MDRYVEDYTLPGMPRAWVEDQQKPPQPDPRVQRLEIGISEFQPSAFVEPEPRLSWWRRWLLGRVK